MSKDLKRCTEIIELLGMFTVNGINAVGIEPEVKSSLKLNLKADSGYQTNQTYRNVNALQWCLIVSILESDIGKKKEADHE